ncbi:unnamed protein product [Urochloa humidicola]
MPRLGKPGSQPDRGSAKRGGSGASPPAAPQQHASVQMESPPAPTGPWWPGFGGCGGSSASPHGNQIANPWL